MIVLLGVGLAGCGYGGQYNAVSNVERSRMLAVPSGPAALVPDWVRIDGVLLMGTDASHPPNESVDPDTRRAVGWDIELAAAIARKLGLRPEFQNAGIDTIIPGVQSRKYEMGVSSLTDNKEREQVVDFVTYYDSGTAWATREGNPEKADPGNPCGLTVGVRRGTAQVGEVAALSDACVHAGKPAILSLTREQQTEVNADLVAGRTDAMLADTPVIGFAVKQTGGKLRTLGTPHDPAPYGYALGKDADRLQDAILAALKQTMADGTYQAILTKWGVQQGAIADPKINGAQD
ncbi:ABC transporter substrate-binding protein [Acrocarpospora corrugata]|uniref:ABC transporter substrate-binding protein n=1 Tax=Acrocarpospora corrugata TaxID=35763 RepID=UPI001FE61419|nr:ABC transporter substrate-binding protein [Acrocarpospora corrugata]